MMRPAIFSLTAAVLVCSPLVSAQRARVGVFFIDSRPDSFPFGGRRVAWKRRARTPLAGRFPFLDTMQRDECNYTNWAVGGFYCHLVRHAARQTKGLNLNLFQASCRPPHGQAWQLSRLPGRRSASTRPLDLSSVGCARVMASGSAMVPLRRLPLQPLSASLRRQRCAVRRQLPVSTISPALSGRFGSAAA